ncbi:unnamed protein product, partial [Allacma fusca]
NWTKPHNAHDRVREVVAQLFATTHLDVRWSMVEEPVLVEVALQVNLTDVEQGGSINCFYQCNKNVYD